MKKIGLTKGFAEIDHYTAMIFPQQTQRQVIVVFDNEAPHSSTRFPAVATPRKNTYFDHQSKSRVAGLDFFGCDS